MSLATRSYRSAARLGAQTPRSNGLAGFSLGSLGPLGPSGSAGPTGPTGPSGPSGPAGPSGLQVPPAPAGPAALQGALAALGEVAALFGDAPLSSAERSELGGAVFRAAPALSYQLAAAILFDPSRYGAHGAAAKALRAKQAEADAWLQLREVLGRLFALAGDEYLRAQGASTRGALALLRRVPPRDSGGLRAAYTVLGAHRAACAAARPRRPAPAAAASSGASSSAAAPGPSPRELAARRERRRGALAAGCRLFFSSLLKKPAASPCTRAPDAEIAEVRHSAPERKPAMNPTPLSQLFQQQFNLTTTPPPSAPAVAEPSAAQLRALEADAEAQARKTPAPFLSEEQRGAFAQKRSPQLGEILRQCALGLAAAPDFARQIPVTAQICQNIVQVDDATTQLIKASGDAYDAASQGVQHVAAEATELGTRVLEAVAAAAPSNYPLVLQFASALSLYEAAAQKQKDALRKAEAAVRPAREDAAAATQQSEEARALADFERRSRR